MEATPTPRVKICCIASRAEACAAIRAGASALGLVSRMPSGPGVIADELIAAIARDVPPPIATFLLTSLTDAREIVAQQKRLRATTLQLVDRLERGSHEDLRRALPGIRIVQVVHIRGEESYEEALSVARRVDALLLDSGNPALAVKELGGTGRTHNWEISRRIRAAVDVPVFLAGGLHAGNVGAAIAQVGPFAVDVCSGVRSGGALDESKLADFVRAVHGGAVERA